MAVWLDRKSPRDLYDLWAPGNLGLIDAEALDLFKRFGPTEAAASVADSSERRNMNGSRLVA